MSSHTQPQKVQVASSTMRMLAAGAAPPAPGLALSLWLMARRLARSGAQAFASGRTSTASCFDSGMPEPAVSLSISSLDDGP